MNIWKDKKYPIILSCAKYLEPWVEDEVRALGYRPIDKTDNIVVVEGSMTDVFKLNLKLRCAHRVLVPLFRGLCRHVRELYTKTSTIDWENLLDPDGYFSVSSIVHNDTVRDTRLPSLTVKDAIADRMRAKCQRRPDSGPDYDRGAAVFLHWERNTAIIYLDTSGSPLCKRGYRKIPGSAPMQETLAAACIDAMGWRGDTPFVSPMCGSGTPAIEAAIKALGKAPGSMRAHFGFMSIKGYTQLIPGAKAPRTAPRQHFGASPEQIWKDMLAEAAETEKTSIPKIIATDISPDTVQYAMSNAHAAGVDKYIEFKACDFADTPIPDEKGTVFLNPEYGIRLGDPAELAVTYERIGTWLNEKCSGWMGALLTGNPDLAHQVDLFYKTRVPFYNGPIDCRLFLYEGCERHSRKEVEDVSAQV